MTVEDAYEIQLENVAKKVAAGEKVIGMKIGLTDAAAATAVLRQLRPPHRVLVILEGESLFNDASALLVYRLAVAAAVTGSFSPWSAAPALAVVAAGSVVLAALLSRISLYVSARIRDVATAVIVQFVSTFAVWLIAEQLHLSGIITVVVFAILVARVAPDVIPARLRIQSYAVWEVAVFVLNVLAFILVGLQLKPILRGFGPQELLRYAAAAAAVCAAVIVVRIVWVMGYTAVARWRGVPSMDITSSTRERSRPSTSSHRSGSTTCEDDALSATTSGRLKYLKSR
jgi:CPA1 family monovalent cation:H+ antiporter